MEQGGIDSTLAKACRLPGPGATAVIWTSESTSGGVAGSTDMVDHRTGKTTHLDDQILCDVSKDGTKILTQT